jgi:hypothetical protein
MKVAAIREWLLKKLRCIELVPIVNDLMLTINDNGHKVIVIHAEVMKSQYILVAAHNLVAELLNISEALNCFACACHLAAASETFNNNTRLLTHSHPATSG